MPRTPDPEVGVRAPVRSNRVVSLSKAHSPKVLVIPRKRWLRPNMTEKLFTGMLRINQPTIHKSFVQIAEFDWLPGRQKG